MLVRKFLPSAFVVVLFILFLAVIVAYSRSGPGGTGDVTTANGTTFTSILSTKMVTTTELKTSVLAGQSPTTQTQSATVVVSTTQLQETASGSTQQTTASSPQQTSTNAPPATSQDTPSAATTVSTPFTDTQQTTSTQNGVSNVDPLPPPSQTSTTADSAPTQTATTPSDCQKGCVNEVPEFPLGIAFVFVLAIPLLFIIRRASGLSRLR